MQEKMKSVAMQVAKNIRNVLGEQVLVIDA